MIKTETRRRRVAWRVWVALALVGVLAASCGKKNDNDKTDQSFDFEKPPENDRPLNPTEIDSLRSMKITHHVTRDEYWDLKGGVIGNDRLEVWYLSRKIYVLQAIAVLKQMDMVADKIEKDFGKLPPEHLVVLTAPNLPTFREVTGLDWWHYALIKGDTLSMQTPMTLFMRGLLTTASQREYSRWALGHLSNEQAPGWLRWGLSSYLAEELDVLRGQRKEFATVPLLMDIKDIDRNLAEQKDRIETRRAIYNAYLMVNQLIETYGMPSVANFLLAFADNPDPNAAAQKAFSKSYDEIVQEAQTWKEPPAS